MVNVLRSIAGTMDMLTAFRGFTALSVESCVLTGGIP